VSGLRQLQSLTLSQTHAAIPFLQHAAQQAKLQELELALWGSSQQQLQQVADALGKCKQLTELHLTRCCDSVAALFLNRVPGGKVNLVGVRAQLQDLRQLQRLQLTHIKWDIVGASQLAVLTSLTSL
jgi:hypothetical protein